ncbi:hypothetical protein [Marinibacterium profundimaris]|uniref:Uncharacterized protein n=1 Tax=Marinibacterium profundimaris TaxID=1679460 RepID=A0A225NPC7_9RHOB|nr:hypothetical protein [Marinibacterium profundimaris]OWU74671.1 hypothetical protein ATO3_08570 [Marinibacterium profundimaris]
MRPPCIWRHASQEYRATHENVKASTALVRDNMVNPAVDGGFRVIRGRLSTQLWRYFAVLLTSVVRAIFVAGWQVADTH